MKTLLTYVITAPVLFIIDLVWLGVISKSLYAKYLGPIMRESFNMPAAILFYICYTIGLVYFAITPALDNGSWVTAFGNGAMLGFIAYMTYDLTNLAVLKNFAWQIVPIDILWGTILSGAVSTIVFFIIKAINL